MKKYSKYFTHSNKFNAKMHYLISLAKSWGFDWERNFFLGNLSDIKVSIIWGGGLKFSGMEMALLFWTIRTKLIDLLTCLMLDSLRTVFLCFLTFSFSPNLLSLPMLCVWQLILFIGVPVFCPTLSDIQFKMKSQPFGCWAVTCNNA